MTSRRIRVDDFGQPFDGCHEFNGAPTRPAVFVKSGSFVESVIPKVLVASRAAFPRIRFDEFGKTDSTDWTDSTERSLAFEAILRPLRGHQDDTVGLRSDQDDKHHEVILSEAMDRFLPRLLNCPRPKAIPRSRRSHGVTTVVAALPQDDTLGLRSQQDDDA